MTHAKMQTNTTTKKIPEYRELMHKVQKTINNVWNIGNRIHQPSIDRWLDNFTGAALNDVYSDTAADREKQLALFLLCNFVYYNENEVKHLVRTMFEKYAHNVFILEEKTEVTDADFNALIKKTQFTYLGNISESSSYLLYHFRQENDLSKQCFVEKSITDNVVFIDDFSITGSQAYDYINNIITKPNWDSKKKIYVLLMVATEDAIETLNKISGITILPCIVLDEKSKTFSDDSIVFADFVAGDKIDAQKVCEYYGELIKPNINGMTALGFGDCGYMFGTYYNIPDNTLPIFWSSQNDWNYLFKRYDKKYGLSGVALGGRYV